MASYLKDVPKTTDGYKYDFVNNFNKLSKKYVTGYLGTANADNRVDNYTANKAMYGDAVWETSNVSGQRKDVLKPQAKSDIIRIKLEVITFLPLILR